MKLWKFWEKDNCPCCDKEDETTTHFPFCDSPHMQEAYTKQLDSFITWMKETDTDPAIAIYFTTVLQDKAFPPTLDEMEPHIDQAAQHQQSIGWDNLLFGRIATSWMELQRDHFKTTNSRRSPERWAADMAYRLLQLSHGLWMARNGYLHERDEQGLLLKEGQTLHDGITERYLRGKGALLPADYHLLDDFNLERLLKKPPSDKYTWLAAITQAHRIARSTRRSEQGHMRADLAHFLVHGVCRFITPTTTTTTNSTTNDTNNNNNDGDS
jgi:hypothetical protein